MKVKHINIKKIINGLIYDPNDSQNKIRYFTDFALKYPKEMKILVNGGVLGPGNEKWHNVSRHCITVAIGGEILAKLLKVNSKKVVKGCLLHDWYKRREVELMNLLGGKKGYEQSNIEDVKLLEKYGVPKDIIKIAHANIIEKVNKIDLKNRKIEEKILHFMDMITAESKFVDYNERQRIVLQKKHNIEFSESFRSQYDGKSLSEQNGEIFKDEQREFEKILLLKPGTLISFLNKKFEEKIINLN